MNFTFEEYINLPKSAVFMGMTDFDALLISVAPASAEVTRLDPDNPVGVGSSWQAQMELFGLAQNLVAEVEEINPDDHFALRGDAKGLRIDLVVRLHDDPDASAHSNAACTRTVVDLDLEASGVTGRMVLKSLRLVKEQIAEKLSARLSYYARELEAQAATV